MNSDANVLVFSFLPLPVEVKEKEIALIFSVLPLPALVEDTEQAPVFSMRALLEVDS